MLGITAQHHLGRQLRATYANIPKGGIPDKIWKLLLLIERQEGISYPWAANCVRQSPVHGQLSMPATP